MQETKKKAQRNRTLVVTPDEEKILEHMLTPCAALCDGYQDDTIINGNLYECIDYIPNQYFDLIIIDTSFFKPSTSPSL